MAWGRLSRLARRDQGRRGWLRRVGRKGARAGHNFGPDLGLALESLLERRGVLGGETVGTEAAGGGRFGMEHRAFGAQHSV
jgi:hypothetical protein